MGENLSELGSALKENWLRSGRKQKKKIDSCKVLMKVLAEIFRDLEYRRKSMVSLDQGIKY